MSATVGLKASPEIKKYFDDTMNEISDNNKDIKVKEQALKYMLDVFNSKKISFGVIELEADIVAAIKTIECKYCRYEGTLIGFVCNETFFSKKKGNHLGGDPELVIQRCMDCKQGKEDDRQKRIDLFLQKDSMKKILNLRAVLMRYVDQGFDVQIFMCNAPLLHESSIKVSYDGKRMPCYQQDDEVLNIQEHCQNVINPRTNQPPCEYLIDLFHRAIMKEFDQAVKEFAEALPALEAPLESEELKQETIIKEAENVEVSLDPLEESSEESPDEKTDKKKDKKKEKK